MREIKFRAYSEDLGQWFYVPSDSFSLVLNDTQHSVQLWSSDGLIDQFPVDFVEQFTGLQDKNGKDIYDGDVVRIVRLNGSSEAYGKVEFTDGSWIVEQGVFIGSQYIGRCNPEILEVIGNIHENPELLEDAL